MSDDLQFEWRTEKADIGGATVQYRLSRAAALSSITQLEVSSYPLGLSMK